MPTASLDIDLLRSFVAVADSGSFTAAGELVARTQSAISVQIKRLEELLDARVFERTSRSLALTPAGERLLGYARRMLALHDESLRAVTEAPVAGELRVGISEYFQPQQLPTLLARFARRHMQVHLEVRIGLSRGLMKSLDSGDLDVVIGRIEEGGRHDAIWREPLHWAAARGLPIERGQPVPLAVLPAPCSFREQALTLLDRKRRPWRIALTGSGMAGIQAAVSAGVGVSILPASMLLSSMRILDRADGFSDPGELRLGFYQRQAAPTPPVAAFREIVEETLELLSVAKRSA
jgi:DNA-binding transcriptional LysR family regulator